MKLGDIDEHHTPKSVMDGRSHSSWEYSRRLYSEQVKPLTRFGLATWSKGEWRFHAYGSLFEQYGNRNLQNVGDCF